jgi:hypothetical protein
LRDYPVAVVRSPGKEYVHRMSVDIAGERRHALFQHPESSVEFPSVRLGARPSLRFGIGINPEAWDRKTDGVEFRVLLRTAGKLHEVYRRHLDPRGTAADRRWVDESIALHAFARQDVQVILSTGPGPRGSWDFDWSLWSGPALILDEP